jgi:hypothetical protein
MTGGGKPTILKLAVSAFFEKFGCSHKNNFLNVLGRTTFTSKLVEENCWWLRLCFLVETLNLSSIPGYTWNEIAESRDNLLVKSAANGKTDL